MKNPKTDEYFKWEIRGNNMKNLKYSLSRKAERVGFSFQWHFKGNILFYNDLCSVSFPTFFGLKKFQAHREYMVK